MMPVAYQQGKEAFAKGVKCEDCPYDIDSKECDQWVVGWHVKGSLPGGRRVRSAPVTEEDRQKLREQIKGIDEAIHTIEGARIPFDRSIDALQGIRDQVLEAHQVELAGECDACGRLLFAGELGHHDTESDIVYCADHSPTWGDAKRNWDAQERDPIDEEERDEFETALAQFIGNGGNLDEKITHELHANE